MLTLLAKRLLTTVLGRLCLQLNFALEHFPFEMRVYRSGV